MVEPSRNETPHGMAVHPDGDAYVAGLTGSSDFPTQSPYDDGIGVVDAFLTKIGSEIPAPPSVEIVMNGESLAKVTKTRRLRL